MVLVAEISGDKPKIYMCPFSIALCLRHSVTSSNLAVLCNQQSTMCPTCHSPPLTAPPASPQPARMFTNSSLHHARCFLEPRCISNSLLERAPVETNMSLRTGWDPTGGCGSSGVRYPVVNGTWRGESCSREAELRYGNQEYGQRGNSSSAPREDFTPSWSLCRRLACLQPALPSPAADSLTTRWSGIN